MTDRCKILIVDDEAPSLALLAGMLAAEGYQVRPASTGEQALASVAAGLPHLILLDIRMPGLDGFEVCRRLKACEKARDIPLMFISGARAVEERVQGLALGAVDFITKPFQREELLARVRTHVELGRLRADLEKQVAQRTAELRVAIEQLQLEIAERKQVEQALRESEERFRRMADTAPVIMWVSGRSNDLEFCNKLGLTFSGRTMEELAGKGWLEMAHPDDLKSLYPKYLSLTAARSTYQLEYRLRRADGDYRWVLDTAMPRFLADGAFSGYIGSTIDITDLKRNQAQMLESQKLESLGVLAAGIAHDFNNVLGSIFAFADLALSDLPDSPARESVERISAVAIRASEIVNLLLAYAGARGEEIVLEPTDLSKLVEEILQLLKISIPKKVVLHTRLAKGLPAVAVNAPQLRQVVMNLITNASEALGDSEGLIAVTTSSIRVDREFAAKNPTNLPEGDYLRLEVSDTGCGMTEEAQAKTFDPFYTTKFLGRGLGLAVVRGILRSHGGAINVVSAPGRGAMFEVLLPCGGRYVDGKVPAARATEGELSSASEATSVGVGRHAPSRH